MHNKEYANIILYYSNTNVNSHVGERRQTTIPNLNDNPPSEPPTEIRQTPNNNNKRSRDDEGPSVSNKRRQSN